MSEPSIPFGRPAQTMRPESENIQETSSPLKSSEQEIKKKTSQSDDESLSGREDDNLQSDDGLLSGREGDNTLGRPIQKVKENIASGVSLSDMEEEEELVSHASDNEAIYAKAIQFPRHILSGLWLAGLLLAGLMGLFVFGQLLDVVKTLTQLPWWWQVPGWGLTFFFSFIVVYPLVKLFNGYQRLRPARQINMTLIRIQHASSEQLKTARQTILGYLESYDLDEISNEIEQIGVPKEDIQRMKAVKKSLMEENLETSELWLKSFEKDFLSPIDVAITNRINYYAKSTALKIALSPNALMDMAIVLYNGFSLLKDVCLLYRIRPSKVELVYLLMLITLQSYAAGQIEENMRYLEDSVGNIFNQGAMGGLGAKIGGMVGARVGEATMHFFFLQRIGKNMKTRLRPLAM